jgi:site-specific DNA recombinase
MGRLTLNVLLSFAQFERELIGERVRDKIAASKRKGVGGPVPLGYAAVDKKIVVVPAEAAAVRTIFARYLELGSLRVLADDLTRRGFRSKSRKLSNGRRIGGGPFGVGALAYLLKNRFYIGEVIYRGQIYSGGHAPILDRDLFEAAQARLAAQALQRRCRLRGSPALLTGRIFDERGNRMSPRHTNKGGRPLPLLRLPIRAAEETPAARIGQPYSRRRDRGARHHGAAQAPAGEPHRGAANSRQ